MSFHCDPNSSTWRFCNIRAINPDDDSMSDRSSERDEDSDDDDDESIVADDDDEVVMADDDEVIAADDDVIVADNYEIVTAGDDDIVAADYDDDDIIAADDDDEIIVPDKEIIEVDDDEIVAADYDEGIVVADDAEIIAADDNEIIVTDDDEIGMRTVDDKEPPNEESEEMSDNERKFDEETSDKEISCEESSDDDISREDSSDNDISREESSDDDISSENSSDFDLFADETDSDEEVIVEDEDLFNEMLDEFIFEICFESHRAAKLDFMEGKLSVLFWKDFVKYRPEKEVEPDEPIEQNVKGKRKKALKEKLTAFCPFKACGRKISPYIFAKHFASCLTGRAKRKVNYNLDTYFQKMAMDSDDDVTPRRKSAAKSKAPKAAVSAPRNKKAQGTTKEKQKRKPSTAVKQKRKPRTPAYTYQGLLAMTLEERRTFFSEHCGVKLKFSKKDSLCAKEVCTMHSDADRASIRSIHLKPPKHGGTYEYC